MHRTEIERTLITLLGSLRSGSLDGLAGLVEGIPKGRSVRGRQSGGAKVILDCLHYECMRFEGVVDLNKVVV